MLDFSYHVPTGIFFSKDRREEVIEIEEEAEMIQVPGTNERVKIMTQGQWMKGCPEGSEQSFCFNSIPCLLTKHHNPVLKDVVQVG